MSRILPYEINSAGELVDRLRLSSPEWGNRSHKNSEWRFRGHADAKWALLPSAHRRGNIDILINRYRFVILTMMADQGIKVDDYSSGYLDCSACSFAEDVLVLEFTKLCDELGFVKPENTSYRVRPKIFHAMLSKDAYPWEPSPAHALAQHHGIPTRLLDWSYDPLVAAYFAASDASKIYRSGEVPACIAIWAYNNMSIPMFRGLSREYATDRSISPFINAQKGEFTWCKSDMLSANAGHWLSFDEVYLLDIESENNSDHSFSSQDSINRWRDFRIDDISQCIKKFTLPFAEVDELLFILRREG